MTKTNASMSVFSAVSPSTRSRIVPLDKLVAMADTTAHDVHLIVGASDRIPANRMMLSLCSDFFEAMFRSSLMEGRASDVELRELDPKDAKLLVAYSEGRYEPTDFIDCDVAALMKVQDRFVMPALKQSCEAMLRTWLYKGDASQQPGGPEHWEDVARIAGSYGCWDLVGEAAIAASRLAWRADHRHKGCWIPRFTCCVGKQACHPECVAYILRHADFMCVADKFALVRCACSDTTSLNVVAALKDDLLPKCRMWPSEVGHILDADHGGGDDGGGTRFFPPRALLEDMVRGMAASVHHPFRRMELIGGALVSDYRRCMAKVDASIVAESGAGTYQMILAPSLTDKKTCYFSEEVNMASNSEYHVYLNEEKQLGEWWRSNQESIVGAGMHILIRWSKPS